MPSTDQGFKPMSAFARPRPRRVVLCGLIAVSLALGALCGGARPIIAQTTGSVDAGTVVVKAPHAVLMDAGSGAIMFQRGGDDLIYPASMSKLMLLAVTFKALKAGQIKLDDEFFMSEYAWRKGGAPSGTSAMMVPVAKKASVDELLKGIIIQSGNDT